MAASPVCQSVFELDRGDAPALRATTEAESIGAADDPGAPGVALEHVSGDDVNVGGCLLAVQVNHGRRGRVLMGIQAGDNPRHSATSAEPAIASGSPLNREV